MPRSLEGAVDAQVQPASVNFDHWLRIVYCVVRTQVLGLTWVAFVYGPVKLVALAAQML